MIKPTFSLPLLYRQAERYLIWVALIILAVHQLASHNEREAVMCMLETQNINIMRVRNHINELERMMTGVQRNDASSEEVHNHLKEEIHQTIERVREIEKRHRAMDIIRVGGKSVHGLP